ncbi:MAG: M3 family oligoendopeptidase [Armatimonadetes bacterium]|nr:M3 family oligoendopeptidase [Armatimonadota bacterium]
MSSAVAESLPRWDLSVLFDSPEDPRISATWERILQRAQDFETNFRGKIENPDLTAATLASAIGELESLVQQASKPMHFSELLFAANTADPKIGAFLQAQREKATELNVRVLFFELELQSCPEDTISRALSGDELSAYRHYVEVVRKLSPHRLSEAEEVVLEEAANTGTRAWVRLFEEVSSNTEFTLTNPGDGTEKKLNQEEVLTLLRHSDRSMRQAAADSLTQGLAGNERVISFIYNTLLQDHSVGDRLRKHPYPEHSRHLSNELDRSTVDLVVRLCREHYSLVSRFYTVKRQILGLPELTHIDRYAPLFEAEETVTWEEARSIVLGAFGRFNSTLKDRAAEFFDEGWIDAEPRSGKMGGAFCSYITPDTHPVVLMSYLGKMNDVMTLAHELGHGVHAALSRKQSYFNFHGTLPLAELASIFGEMLVFEDLVSKAELKDKVALYAEKIEGIFASVFRQAAMFQFEQACHTARRETGELSREQFGALWHEKLQEMFGDSVKLGEQHQIWWSYVGHFFFAPFYVYAYAFGELLALAIYERSKTAGPEFGQKYVHLLELAGSLSPKDLMATIDVDLDSEAFWRGGFAVLERLVGEFEGYWKEHSK